MDCVGKSRHHQLLEIRLSRRQTCGANMTRSSNAQIAGFTFLFYIATGVTSMVMSAQAVRGNNVAAKLISVGQHLFQMRLTVLLGLIQAICAILLAVTLYSITRDEDPDLALLAMICRVSEGLVGALSLNTSLGLLWLAVSHEASGPSQATVDALGTYLLRTPRGNVDAIFFALGSTLFAWLLLRGRMIPITLAWLGVGASVLLVVALPLQLAGFLSGQFVSFVWIPMAAYEIPLGLWLIIKGVSVPNRHYRTAAKA